MKQADLENMLKEAIGPQRATLRGAMASAAVAALVSVLLLGVSGWFLTGAAIAGLGGVAAVQAFNYLLPSAGIRLMAILRTVSRYGERYCGHRAALLALATVRGRLFTHIMRARDVRAFSAGDAVSRLVQDISALEDRLVRKPALPAALAGGVSGIALTALASLWAAAALALLLLVILLITKRFSPILLDRPAQNMADALGRLRTEMVGYAQASPEIVAYGMAPAIQVVLEKDADDLDAARLQLARGEALIANGLLTMGAGLAMAGVMALSDGASLPLRVLAVLASAGAVESLGGLVRGIMRDAVVRTGLARLEALGGTEIVSAEGGFRPRGQSITLPLPALSSSGAQGSRESVTIEAGQRLGIVGHSGCGKTRLVEALAGLRPEDAAGIRIDGEPLSACSLDDVRALFALSPQDAALLSGTVADNLRVAQAGLSDDLLWEALETACLADDVRAMGAGSEHGGLDHWVGDGGARLSGGQKKRLSLARALLVDRPWLLLDEPSEGLDRETEALLLTRLDEWLNKNGAGLILISHRPALLALCSEMLDFDDLSGANN
ncbi:MAG: ATP-binding cassette domain-containing protein [Sphingobium sp.]|nr:ATP-binding cassette domain-containing protein [Sphingobium sp.]